MAKTKTQTTFVPISVEEDIRAMVRSLKARGKRLAKSKAARDQAILGTSREAAFKRLAALQGHQPQPLPFAKIQQKSVKRITTKIG